MEEKKFDYNSIIGFGLIFIIVFWMMLKNKETETQEQKAKVKTEKVVKPNTGEAQESRGTEGIAVTMDSLTVQKLQSSLGSFAYSATLPSAKDEFTTFENEYISLKIANKGGCIANATLKNFEKFEKNSNQKVELIKDNNSSFNLELKTKDNRVVNTKDLYFEPTLSSEDGKQVLTMKLKTDPSSFLEYRYELSPNDYTVGFDVNTQGLKTVLNSSNPAELVWEMKAFRNEKSISYENRYSEIYFEHNDGKVDYVGLGKDKKEDAEALTFVAFKQHFFTSILMTETPFKSAELLSNDLVSDEKIDTVFTKNYTAKMPLVFNSGELDYKMKWYFGPTDYNTLKKQDKNLEKIVPLGWGIFGWINKFIFVPLFGFLSSFMGLGIAIIIFTILIKVAMSPITFKSFLSQAKMKVLKPELIELNEKFKKDPMKRQQETMALYRKAGVNPMAGCVPALIQIPFMYASFQFFPSAFQLRQQGFLWAKDLSSFDEIYKLPFHIPVYGDHVSLFPILAAIAIFFYMKMTQGDQAMAQPQQEGMPDMTKMMKIMIYISPVMMLLFFNNYGSGLSLYNFISNLITIGIMLVIKKYFIDSDKIHAQIQENKTKPKKETKFQKKMREMMEQAEAQKAIQNKKK